MLQPFPRARLQVWFVRVCSCVLVWTCIAQLVAVGDLWRGHSRLPVAVRFFLSLGNDAAVSSLSLRHQFHDLVSASPPYVPLRVYKSNGYLKVSCNGGLNQMRSEICDMVIVARFLNLTLVVPELDKRSFWADNSNFGDIFDVNHFINTLRDEVHIVKRIPKRFKTPNNILEMPPVSWSNENYYLKQILPLFHNYSVLHFNKTDARLANNGLPLEFQKLRCHVNYQALKFTPQIEALGNKLIKILQERGSYVALHLRYEMDMLAFSGCTHGCSVEEANQLKRLRSIFDPHRYLMPRPSTLHLIAIRTLEQKQFSALNQCLKAASCMPT